MIILKDIVKSSEKNKDEVRRLVAKIIDRVKSKGDDAIIDMTEHFDGVKIEKLEIPEQVIGNVGIDSLAGPSEILIIADESASSDFIVIDLLAQCEHDPATRSALVTTSRKLANRVLGKIEKEASTLATSKVILKSWEENGQIILVDNLEEAIEFANNYAPEHLEVQTSCNNEIVNKLVNFGSLFIGHHSPVAFGDYVSGPNHTLPTMRTARYSNGLWVGNFIKVSCYQKINKKGAIALSAAGSHMAKIEGLLVHQRSINIRTGKL